MAKIRLDNASRDRISRSVAEAEQKTSGEIAVAFIRESYHYAIQEMRFSLVVGFVYFMVMLYFTPAVEEVIRNRLWEYHPSFLLMAYGFSTFLVILLAYLVTNIPFIDRLIVSKQVMHQKVRERAVRHFIESGVDNTRDRTGILIFISLLEHRVELIADRGIREKIDQEQWAQLVEHIADGIKKGKFVTHLTESIARCGELLSEHFPRKSDDVNELKDGMETLET